MIAIGFLLAVMGIITVRVFGEDDHNSADYIGALSFIIGIIMLIIGTAIWLWKVAP